MSDFHTGCSDIEDSLNQNNNQLLCPISESQEADECDFRQANFSHKNENKESRKNSLQSPLLQKNQFQYDTRPNNVFDKVGHTCLIQDGENEEIANITKQLSNPQKRALPPSYLENALKDYTIRSQVQAIRVNTPKRKPPSK